MNGEQAIEAAKQIGVAPGNKIFLTSEGQVVNNPGPAERTNNWHVMHNLDGTWNATKKTSAN